MLRYGFECIEFEFEEHEAKLILPEERNVSPFLALKTEYFGAFPDTETELLKRGHYLCYLRNDNRWGIKADLDRKARFIRYLLDKYDIPGKCVPVGMSCGGIFAVKLASLYPELIACVYADAPVVNYMSCPCGFGASEPFDADHKEILTALSLPGLPELLAYRDMPLDHIGNLIKNRIPMLLVAGDSDRTVPYHENGVFLEKAYRESGIPHKVIIKPGCDHHPHGLEDAAEAADYIETLARSAC